MKYLCLCYSEENKLQTLSPTEWDGLMEETFAYLDQVGKNGNLIDAQPLQGVETATSIRIRNNETSVTDGPFAETKEQLGGYFLIEARDLNEAIQIASKWPPARMGTVEVRPIREHKPQEHKQMKAS
jgi:hypothetical protein